MQAFKTMLSAKLAEGKLRIVEDFQVIDGKSKTFYAGFEQHVAFKETANLVLNKEDVLISRAANNV
jgi:ribosomal protein L4